jgi:RNA polymerase sigma factor (sigma-70 family)
MKDSLIIDELKKGNTKVFSLIYNSYPLIENYILNNSGSKDDAKDIFQNTLLIFYQKVKEPDFELTSKLSTYLFAICKNAWLKTLRSRKTKEPLQDHIQLTNDEETHQTNEDSIVEFIQEKLTAMGDPCQSLIIFHEFHKMKWEEIAKKMNYASAHAARNQKYKCLVRLKKMIPLQLKNALLNI